MLLFSFFVSTISYCQPSNTSVEDSPNSGANLTKGQPRTMFWLNRSFCFNSGIIFRRIGCFNIQFHHMEVFRLSFLPFLKVYCRSLVEHLLICFSFSQNHLLFSQFIIFPLSLLCIVLLGIHLLSLYHDSFILHSIVLALFCLNLLNFATFISNHVLLWETTEPYLQKVLILDPVRAFFS